MVELDSFLGNTDYNSVELANNNDEVSKNTLSRPLRNIYNIVNNLDFVNNKISLHNGLEEGVHLNDFEIDPGTDIKTILVKNSSNNIIRKHYLRVSPGVVFLNGKNIPHLPNLSIAERQLIDILELDKEKDKVNIEYSYEIDKFKIQIQKNNQIYSYYKGDTYGDSFSGYDTGIEALLSVYGDSSNFPELRNTINENIENIFLEENIILSGGDSIFIGLDDQGYLIGDTYSTYFPLYHIKTSLVSNEIKINSFSDLRKSSQGGLIDNELIENGNFSNGEFPVLGNSGTFYTEGNINGVISNLKSFGNILGDSLSGLITSNTGGTLYFSGSDQSIYNFLPENTYKFSIKININSGTNIRFNLYEYSQQGTLITSSVARNIIEDWQELIITKKINENTEGISLGINMNGGSIYIDDLSVKNLTSKVGSKFVTVSNISGDTLSINVIQSNGDSQITFSNKIIGDTLGFITFHNSTFTEGLSGDTLKVETINNLRYLKSNNNSNIILLDKLVGDTNILNTLRVDNILGTGSIISSEFRRDEVKNITGNFTVPLSDEGKTLRVTSSNNITINLPNLDNSHNGFYLYIIKNNSSNNTITINPDGSDNINGENNFTITEDKKSIKIKWAGSWWTIEKTFSSFPLSFEEGGSEATTLNEIRTNLNILDEEDLRDRFAFKNHTHNQYITSIPSELLTQNEGDGRYYTRSQASTRINTIGSDIRGNAPNNLNTMEEFADSIGNDTNFGETIRNSLNNKITRNVGDNLYRQDILFRGSSIVLSDSTTKILAVNSFSNNEYRWLKVVYVENGKRFTGRFNTNDLVQSFPVTFGGDYLYTINYTNNVLYTVNPILGTASRVHASNTLGSGNWLSLASHNGILYTINNINLAFYTINPTLGTASRVHSSNTFLGSGIWNSLTFYNGTLYAINYTNRVLYTVNLTLGTFSRVHASNNLENGQWGSLTSHNGTLYAINDDNNALYTINPTLGTSSRVHASNNFGIGQWLSLVSHNGTLYAINNDNRAIYTINPTLGTASRVHASNTLGSGNWYSLASGYSQINTPIQGFYTPNSDRLTTWRRSSDSNSRLRFNLVNGTSDVIIEEIVGIP